MESYAAPYKLTNGEVAHLAITNDISDKVQHESELEIHQQALADASRLAALGQMAAGIAHEVNNPLTVILAKTFSLKKKD